MSRVPENQSSKTHQPTSLGQLPDDTACDIISRLSPKEISIFKTCSKKWNQTLSGSSFKNLYQERSQKNPKLFIAQLSHIEELDHKGEILKELFLHLSLLDLEGEEEKEGTIIYANIRIKMDAYTRMLYAANGGGLICFVNHKEFFIFNPTSKKTASLPETSSTSDDDFSMAGFGYAPFSNEYIFVHIFDVSRANDNFDMRCEWLALSEVHQGEDIHTSLSWKVLETPCPFPVKESGVLVDGLFYFCISDICEHTAKQIILSVDLKTELFKIIGHPDETVYDEHSIRFVEELNGQLCFGDRFEALPVMDLWILKNAENTEWEKLCRVDLSRLHGFDEHFLSQITLLGLRNGELIIQSMRSDRLDFYNIEEETSREGTVSVPIWSQACLYTVSLSFLNIRSS